MDYELIVSALQKASAFDLYRLQSAIGHLLDDPLLLNAIKRQLRPVRMYQRSHRQNLACQFHEL
jgi:hypothetical protein